jgi:DNA-binding PadR family transcriptional regulator
MPRDPFSFDPRPGGNGSLERDREQQEAPHRPRIKRRQEYSEPPRVHTRETPSLKPEREDSPRAYAVADRTFLVRESELYTMTELGTFRVVNIEDLARFAYASDRDRMERDLRRLKAQGLVSERTLPVSGRKTIRVLALTKTGKRALADTNRVREGQRIYHGIVKPREAKHDAELYRLFQAEAARIETEGGRPLRVLLDYELKRDLNRDRVRLGERRSDPEEIARLAEKHGLTVVNGKIPLPDMRIEYQTAELELRRIDLELATRHYRPRGVAEKAKAGFSLYSHPEDASRLRRILDEQELSARIFAL